MRLPTRLPEKLGLTTCIFLTSSKGIWVRSENCSGPQSRQVSISVSGDLQASRHGSKPKIHFENAGSKKKFASSSRPQGTVCCNAIWHQWNYVCRIHGFTDSDWLPPPDPFKGQVIKKDSRIHRIWAKENAQNQWETSSFVGAQAGRFGSVFWVAPGVWHHSSMWSQPMLFWWLRVHRTVRVHERWSGTRDFKNWMDSCHMIQAYEFLNFADMGFLPGKWKYNYLCKIRRVYFVTLVIFV